MGSSESKNHQNPVADTPLIHMMTVMGLAFSSEADHARELRTLGWDGQILWYLVVVASDRKGMLGVKLITFLNDPRSEYFNMGRASGTNPGFDCRILH